MNREIKFRAWDKFDKRMIYDAWRVRKALHWGNDFFDTLAFLHDDEPKLNNYELMQYVGLKDKNGENIYEGDVLRFINTYKNTTWLNKVSFKNGAFVCEGKYGIYHNFNSWNFLIVKMEIVGNVYENPELLKEE